MEKPLYNTGFEYGLSRGFKRWVAGKVMAIANKLNALASPPKPRPEGLTLDQVMARLQHDVHRNIDPYN